MSSVKTFLKFEALLKKYNSVYRDLESLHIDGNTDNDIEHSYRVAILCWMLIDEYKLKLDTNKVIRYALLHDLPEVYAGDVSIYANQAQKNKGKEREVKAIKTLAKQFPKQKSLWKDLHEYEMRKNAESKFVYLIEKLEPILVVLVSAPDHWIKRNIHWDEFLDKKQKKIKDLETVAQFLNKDLMAYLKKYRTKFFGKP
jgi:putative hydrolase of HD superfamily